MPGAPTATRFLALLIPSPSRPLFPSPASTPIASGPFRHRAAGMTSGSPPGSPPSPPGSQRKRSATKDSVGLYAAQCYMCYKWRMIPTKEEFETLRENFTEDPWFCSRRPDCSCEDPADIEYDSSRIWVLDKPNIPKPPPETERLVIMRRDFSKMDTYYVMPNGKRARCAGDVDKFLEANPEYKNRISTSDFNFAPPKVVEETVSHNSAWKAAKAKKQDKADASSAQK
ncbi:hypothetical protein SEVIR_3G254000v4 [Setaria viridis]|uniref:MBD domain-containing protein n=1 Tax=Setaria viridis TaxID=4556 RepID=A0A4V6D9U5_SETVI|nr:methyl-CpG-binding domain-containing protein 4-like [Setaria viridis]TKW27396.1 hypothetical protein SEVIR_3G254000v2 [Setaria viridis]